MRKALLALKMVWLLLLACAVLQPEPAQAERVEVRISISRQEMDVYHEGRLIHTWPVSTAKKGYVTPKGNWTPQFLSKDHRSSRYNNAPMPWAIFYSGNYAIHGTDAIKRLGKPASHGCVRLHPGNARILYRMVRAEGMANTRISVVQ